MKSLISLYLLSFLLHLSSSADWCYQTQVSCDGHCKGPERWSEVNAECGNARQSPVNIVTKKTKLDERLTPFKFTGYQTAFDSTVRNNGHSVQVNLPITAAVSGGNLGDTYKAVQFHLHWGTDGGPGSEHTVDGEQYPMEKKEIHTGLKQGGRVNNDRIVIMKLHIVHMKQRYNRIQDALKDPSGIAVLGFFYEESNTPNKKYDQFIYALRSVQNTNGNATLRKVSLNQFILSEENMTNYYRYDGSLTTPGCMEAVVWTVFENPIPLDKEQLRAFSSLKFNDGKPMVGTFRPVQSRNGRTVYRSSGPAVLASAVLLFVSITTTFILSHLN